MTNLDVATENLEVAQTKAVKGRRVYVEALEKAKVRLDEAKELVRDAEGRLQRFEGTAFADLRPFRQAVIDAENDHFSKWGFWSTDAEGKTA